jgi:hypothetical protein
MKHVMLRFVLALGAMTLPHLSDPAWSQTQSTPAEGEAENSGQDPARPVRRFDIRLQYQQIDDDLEAVISTLRMDWPFPLGDGWKLSTRIDVPLTTNNVPSLDNMDGDWEFGLSDLLVQGLLIRPLNHAALIAGTQVIIPTATQDQFGSGKLRLVPTVGAVYYPSFLPRGSFIAQVARYDFDITGDDDRADVSIVLLQPIANVALPDRWFVTFAPELRIDLNEDGDIFLPFDVTVGKKVTRDIVTSLEFKHEIIDELPLYEWSLEARVGFFF